MKKKTMRECYNLDFIVYMKIFLGVLFHTSQKSMVHVVVKSKFKRETSCVHSYFMEFAQITIHGVVGK